MYTVVLKGAVILKLHLMNAARQWIVKVTHAKQLQRRQHISDICSEEINENIVWKK